MGQKVTKRILAVAVHNHYKRLMLSTDAENNVEIEKSNIMLIGPTGTGTLCAFARGPRVPSILGFDPLFQFMHERDVARAISLALARKIRGVFNVAGPQPVPLSVLIRETGRRPFPLPEIVFNALLGRFGLPKLPRGRSSTSSTRW